LPLRPSPRVLPRPYDRPCVQRYDRQYVRPSGPPCVQRYDRQYVRPSGPPCVQRYDRQYVRPSGPPCVQRYDRPYAQPSGPPYDRQCARPYAQPKAISLGGRSFSGSPITVGPASQALLYLVRGLRILYQKRRWTRSRANLHIISAGLRRRTNSLALPVMPSRRVPSFARFTDPT
jgi:hypothetical protein